MFIACSLGWTNISSAQNFEELCDALIKTTQSEFLSINAELTSDNINMCASGQNSSIDRLVSEKSDLENGLWTGTIRKSYATDGILQVMMSSISPSSEGGTSATFQIVKAKKGDTLDAIAKNAYGQSSFSKYIMRVTPSNPLSELAIGEMIVLPTIVGDITSPPVLGGPFQPLVELRLNGAESKIFQVAVDSRERLCSENENPITSKDIAVTKISVDQKYDRLFKVEGTSSPCTYIALTMNEAFMEIKPDNVGVWEVLSTRSDMDGKWKLSFFAGGDSGATRKHLHEKAKAQQADYAELGVSELSAPVVHNRESANNTITIDAYVSPSPITKFDYFDLRTADNNTAGRGISILEKQSADPKAAKKCEEEEINFVEYDLPSAVEPARTTPRYRSEIYIGTDPADPNICGFKVEIFDLAMKSRYVFEIKKDGKTIKSEEFKTNERTSARLFVPFPDVPNSYGYFLASKGSNKLGDSYELIPITKKNVDYAGPVDTEHLIYLAKQRRILKNLASKFLGEQKISLEEEFTFKVPERLVETLSAESSKPDSISERKLSEDDVVKLIFERYLSVSALVGITICLKAEVFDGDFEWITNNTARCIPATKFIGGDKIEEKGVIDLKEGVNVEGNFQNDAKITLYFINPNESNIAPNPIEMGELVDLNATVAPPIGPDRPCDINDKACQPDPCENNPGQCDPKIPIWVIVLIVGIVGIVGIVAIWKVLLSAIKAIVMSPYLMVKTILKNREQKKAEKAEIERLKRAAEEEARQKAAALKAEEDWLTASTPDISVLSEPAKVIEVISDSYDNETTLENLANSSGIRPAEIRNTGRTLNPENIFLQAALAGKTFKLILTLLRSETASPRIIELLEPATKIQIADWLDENYDGIDGVDIIINSLREEV